MHVIARTSETAFASKDESRDVDYSGSRPVARFWSLQGQNTYLGETIFVFIIFLNQIFKEQENFGGHSDPECPPWLRPEWQ